MNDEKNPLDDLGKEEPRTTNSNPREPLTKEEMERIKRLISDGMGVNEVARQLKRSASTVSRAVKKLKISKAVGISQAGRLLDQKLNAAESLYKIHKKAFEIIDKLTIKDASNANEYGFVVLKAIEAVRKMLETQLRIWEALYRVEEITRWQNDLMDTLGEELPDARERFYRRLQERRPV